MSDDTDTSTAAASIQNSVQSAVDAQEIESMLEDDTTETVGRELGSRIGRELGSRIGRELGTVVAHDARERKGPRTILRNAAHRLVELVKELLGNVDVKGITSNLVSFAQDVVSDGSPEGGLASVLPDESSSDAESEGEAESNADASADETDTEDGAGDDAVPSDLSADDVQDLKKETYRELLEEMSYRDLQSLAKDVGVKANLSQDEMTDRIVEQFSEGNDA